MRTGDWKGWAKRNSTNVLRLTIVLVFLGLAVWAITLNRYELVIANREPWLWLTVALVSVGPELAGIVIGVVTIDYLNERRQTEQLKAQLIRQMGMHIPDVAVPAARELAHYKWLQDGSLIGAHLRFANLTRADLSSANLSKANLRNAVLLGAWLVNADLTGATLTNADLRATLLINTTLRETLLIEADLSSALMLNAQLNGANLSGANLSDVQLDGADLRGIRYWTIKQLSQAKTLEGTTMPDGICLMRAAGKPHPGPSFEAWKAQYLNEFGGSESDSRGTGDEPDEATDEPDANDTQATT